MHASIQCSVCASLLADSLALFAIPPLLNLTLSLSHSAKRVLPFVHAYVFVQSYRPVDQSTTTLHAHSRIVIELQIQAHTKHLFAICFSIFSIFFPSQFFVVVVVVVCMGTSPPSHTQARARIQNCIDSLNLSALFALPADLPCNLIHSCFVYTQYIV